MLNHTARVTAEGLGAEYCKVMEYIPSENRLLVRAGVGWGEGVVGNATVGADLASACRLCLAHGQARNFQPSRKRATISYSRVAHGTRHSSRDECHFARRWLTIRRARSRQPIRRRVSASMTSHFCKVPRTSSAWPSSSSSISASCKPPSSAIRSYSRRSTTA